MPKKPFPEGDEWKRNEEMKGYELSMKDGEASSFLTQVSVTVRDGGIDWEGVRLEGRVTRVT